jgi:hypothetical protein
MLMIIQQQTQKISDIKDGYRYCCNMSWLTGLLDSRAWQIVNTSSCIA